MYEQYHGRRVIFRIPLPIPNQSTQRMFSLRIKDLQNIYLFYLFVVDNNDASKETTEAEI